MNLSYSCFVANGASKRSDAAVTAQAQQWWGPGGWNSQYMSSTCSCLSLTSQTRTMTAATTITQLSSHVVWSTHTITASPSTVFRTVTSFAKASPLLS